MRIKLFGVGLILLFLGLTMSAFSRNAVTKRDENLEKIAEGLKDVPEVSNVTLTKNEIFVAKYYGGGSHVNPNDVIVNVLDPYGNVTSGIVYATQFKDGIVANSTGSYTIQVGAPGLLDPSSPLLIVIFKKVVTTNVEYPNSNLLPFALASITIGAGICAFAATSKGKPARRLGKSTSKSTIPKRYLTLHDFFSQ